MSTRYEYFISDAPWWDLSGYAVYDTNWSTQTFTPLISHAITLVKLKLARFGSPGTATASIQATDSDGKPTGSDLCSGTTNGNTLSTIGSYEWRTITFSSGYALSANAKYAIVLRISGGGISNQIAWRYDSSGDYSRGQRVHSTDGGSSWGLTSHDFEFEEWGTSVGRDIQNNIPVRRIAGDNKFPYKFPFRFHSTITRRTVNV